MQVQTVFKAGNSNVVAIPKSLGNDIGITSGKKVIVDRIEDKIIIQEVSKTKTKKTSSSIADKGFKKWLKEALKEDAEILDELANR